MNNNMLALGECAWGARKYHVVTIGSCLRDIIFYTDQAEFIKNPKNDPTKIFLLGFEYGAKIKSDEIYYSFGGGAANTAVNFAGLGLKTGIISGLGNDGIGAEIRLRLKQKKVETHLLKTYQKSQTGISFLVVDKKSSEHFILVSYGANNELDNNLRINNNTDWYYISSLSSKKWPKILEKVIKQKSRIAWNPGGTQLKKGYKCIKKYLPNITALILNKDEAIELCLSAGIKMKKWTVEKIGPIIQSWGVGIVLITDGINGAWAYSSNKMSFIKPSHKKPKDTTGAGDCFGSTFIAALIKTKGNIDLSMKAAMINTSSLVFVPGAQEGLLSWPQIMREIKS